jgi:glycosyltransferase involved in cell wall biosynthesis
MLPLMAQQHQVTLLVNRDIDNDFSRRVKTAGVRVEVLRNVGLHSPKNIICLRKKFKDYDVVHVHLFPTSYWAALASMFSSVQLVFTEHSTSNRRRGKWYFRPIEQFIYSRFQCVISISQQTKNSLTDWLRVSRDSSRFVVVNNGINLSAFSHLHNQKDYPHTLVMVSRFAASKDQETVIRAMALLPNDLHAIFVGDGENLAHCKELAASLGVSDRTHFVGSQLDVASWLAKADIGVQSSHWEGFGLTAVEMMAAGLPVVASSVEGLRQVVEGAGILFEAGNAQELADAVSRLLSDTDYYKKIACQCAARAVDYDIRTMVDQYLKIYSSLSSAE